MPRRKKVSSNAPSDRGSGASRTFSLKLTALQRKSLSSGPRIQQKLKTRLSPAGTGTQVVAVTRKELERLERELSDCLVFIPNPDKKRLLAVHRKVVELLDSLDEPTAVETAPAPKAAPKSGDFVYQFKIALIDLAPPVWRRIQVPDCDLGQFHRYLQGAMGWQNCHMHQFVIDGERFSSVGPFGSDPLDDFRNEDAVRLSDLIPQSGRRRVRWLYEYDFGDDWRHEVLFEGFPMVDAKAPAPRCLAGERACPPEDCGGPWGYADYLDAINDPEHEEHDSMLEWRGPFDPEAFDAGKATKEMKSYR